MEDFQKVIKKSKDVKDIIDYIKKENKKYESALLFSLDGIFLDDAKKVISSLDESSFIEARFFDTDKELFVFYDGEEYKAVETDKTKYKEYIIKTRENRKEKELTEEELKDFDENYIILRDYILDEKFKGYSKIKIKEFINYDEDGQAYVKASCLDGVE